MQHDPLQQRPGNQNLSARDEDLVLFQELEKRESEAALHLHQRVPAESAAEDIFSSSEWDEHDYDWLMTPPATLLLPSLEQNALADNVDGLVTTKKTSAANFKVGSSKPETFTTKPLVRAARRISDVHKPADASVALANAVSRKSFSGTTGSLTPTPPSATISRAISKPSASIKTGRSSAGNSTSSATSGCSKMQTFKATSPSSHTVISTRLIKPSATPTCVNGVSPASLKPASVDKTKTNKLPLKNVSSIRPASKAQVHATHPATLQGVPQDSLSNVRSSAAGGSFSNPRGLLPLKHNASTAIAKATQSQSADLGSHDRGPSRETMVARGCVSSVLLDVEKSSSRRGIPRDAAVMSNSHGAGSKMVGKNAQPRKPISSSQRQTQAVIDTSARKGAQPTSPRGKMPRPAPQQSSGFGRNLSRKSLDMALRHMDIGGETPNGVHSFMSSVPRSSLYSVRSRNSRAIIDRCGNLRSSTTRLPSASSGRESSESGLRVVIDLEGSEFGDETSSSRASPSSQPDPSVATCNERKVTCWLGSPDYMDDDGAEMMKNFEQELASVSGTESPLGSIDCSDFTLEPT